MARKYASKLRALARQRAEYANKRDKDTATFTRLTKQYEALMRDPVVQDRFATSALLQERLQATTDKIRRYVDNNHMDDAINALIAWIEGVSNLAHKPATPHARKRAEFSRSPPLSARKKLSFG